MKQIYKIKKDHSVLVNEVKFINKKKKQKIFKYEDLVGI